MGGVCHLTAGRGSMGSHCAERLKDACRFASVCHAYSAACRMASIAGQRSSIGWHVTFSKGGLRFVRVSADGWMRCAGFMLRGALEGQGVLRQHLPVQAADSRMTLIILPIDCPAVGDESLGRPVLLAG
jgi:hypothetical protein